MQGIPGPKGERGAKGDSGLPVCSESHHRYHQLIFILVNVACSISNTRKYVGAKCRHDMRPSV